MYNEPDNVATQPEYAELELKDKYTYICFVKKVVRWAREVNPSQPLTIGLWKGDPELWGTPEKMRPLERLMVENSDIISFHSYDNPKITQIKIKELKI